MSNKTRSTYSYQDIADTVGYRTTKDAVRMLLRLGFQKNTYLKPP